MGRSVRLSQPATKLHDHVRELAMRIIASFVTLIVASFVVYAFYEPILDLLRSPLGAPLYYSNPAGSFAFVMKISLMGALIITIPVLAYNLIMFIRPAFEKTISLRRVLLTSLFSIFLAISGAVFAFMVIIPNSLRFFEGFQVSGISALISADSYLGFVTNIIITFIIVFQLPLLITFIDHIKPLTPKRLFGFEKWVVMGSLVIALLTPFAFDVATSLLIAAPIIVLYNLSIAMVMTQHAINTHRINKIIHSTIVKPVTTTELAVNDQMINALADELTLIDKPVPVPVMAQRNTMDFNRAITRQKVTEPDWVKERKQKRAALLANQSGVFSDISRTRRVNRGLVM